MTDDRVDKKLTHEILVGLRNSMADMRRDIRELKASNATILGLLGELVKGTGRENERLVSIETRLDNLEHRVDDLRHPTA
jgi:hypothetical protein